MELVCEVMSFLKMKHNGWKESHEWFYAKCQSKKYYQLDKHVKLLTYFTLLKLVCNIISIGSNPFLKVPLGTIIGVIIVTET
jgi:hypothetical protein